MDPILDLPSGPVRVDFSGSSEVDGMSWTFSHPGSCACGADVRECLRYTRLRNQLDVMQCWDCDAIYELEDEGVRA
jgi:hypothetical protein